MAFYSDPDNVVTMSAQGSWRPGRFESEAVARRAQRLDDSEIRLLQDAANMRGDSIIRAGDLPAKKP